MENEKDIHSKPNKEFNLHYYFGQATIDKVADLYSKIEQPLIVGSTMGIPQRNLSHWVKVLNENPDSAGRKKYTLVNFVWIKIVEQLRVMNVGFELIKELKKELLKPIPIKGLLNKVDKVRDLIEGLEISLDQKSELLKLAASTDEKTDLSNFTMLHMLIIDSIINKLPLSIGIFYDGSYMVLDKSKEHLYSDEEKSQLLFQTHITVSISQILRTFLNSELSGFVVPKIGLFSYAENKLFEVVHSGDYEKIVIHFKDKKMKALELVKSENIKEKIIDILNKDEFGEIIVKKHKGIITKIENTVKVKL